MTKKTIFVVLVFLPVLFVCGCNKIACERMRECYGGSDDDVDECVDEIKDEDYDCRKSFRAYARCLNKEDCKEEKCGDEAEDLMKDCSDFY